MFGWEPLEKKAAGPELDLVAFAARPLSDNWDDTLRRLVRENEFVRDVSTWYVRALVSGGTSCAGGAGGAGVGARYLGF